MNVDRLDERVAALTERQRACLRLVLTGRGSKEIAAELGIEPGTVDQHIKAATRTLGVSQRRQAAQLLAVAEGSGAYQKLDIQSQDIAARGSDAPPPSLSGRERRPVGAYVIREGQAVFEPVYPPQPSPRLPPPIPTVGRPWNDLKLWQRLVWIVTIAASASVLVIGLLGGAKAAIETFHALL